MQQWAILRGRRIDPATASWLMGPFGKVGAKGENFIHTLAKEEDLLISKNAGNTGLLSSIEALNLSPENLQRLSPPVKDFYEKTQQYQLLFTVKWNPIFKLFGKLVNVLFSNRIAQLNIPTSNRKDPDAVSSEIITLRDRIFGEIQHTVWYRTIPSTQTVLYSGVYSTCKLHSGKTCIKAVFPLPNGNATVIMHPSVGEEGELRLESSGKRFGDAGFYFLLNDAKCRYWAQYISYFRDVLIVSSRNSSLSAEQTLTLWGMKVLRFEYQIKRSKIDD